jgi:hypothetical protein
VNVSIVAAPLGAPQALPAPFSDVARTPIDHLTWHRYAAVVHPEDSRGVAVITYSARVTIDGCETHRTRVAGAVGHEVHETVKRCRPRFMTLNGFRETKPNRWGQDYHKAPCKAQWNLAYLQALWVDLDFYKKRAYQNGTPRSMLPLVLDRIRELGLPWPSYIMSSGKGLFAVWLHDRMTPSYLPVWKAMQKRFNDGFVDMGRDIQAMPATQHFRVPGGTNDGRSVEMLWPAYADQVQRYDFDTLRAEILPYTPKQVRAHRKAKALKKAERAEKAEARQADGAVQAKPARKLNRRTFATVVSRDLEKLFEDRFQGHPVPHGERDTWLYHLTTAAAWLLPPDALRQEVKRLAPLCGFAPGRALTLMGSVIRNARRAASGATSRYKRRAVDPRYRTNPRKMVEIFGVSVEEAIRLDLRVIVPLSVKRDRAALRAEAYRRKNGAKSRKVAQAERLALGQWCLEQRAAGRKVTELAFEKKVSTSQIEKATREAKQVAGIGKPLAKPKPGRPRKAKPIAENPYDPSRSMVAETVLRGLDADVSTVVAGGRAAYDDAVHDVHLTDMDTTPAAVSDPAGVAVHDEWDEDEAEAAEFFLGIHKRRASDGLWVKWCYFSGHFVLSDQDYVNWAWNFFKVVLPRAYKEAEERQKASPG